MTMSRTCGGVLWPRNEGSVSTSGASYPGDAEPFVSNERSLDVPTKMAVNA